MNTNNKHFYWPKCVCLFLVVLGFSLHRWNIFFLWREWHCGMLSAFGYGTSSCNKHHTQLLSRGVHTHTHNIMHACTHTHAHPIWGCSWALSFVIYLCLCSTQTQSCTSTITDANHYRITYSVMFQCTVSLYLCSVNNTNCQYILVEKNMSKTCHWLR